MHLESCFDVRKGLDFCFFVCNDSVVLSRFYGVFRFSNTVRFGLKDLCCFRSLGSIGIFWEAALVGKWIGICYVGIIRLSFRFG